MIKKKKLYHILKTSTNLFYELKSYYQIKICLMIA